MIRASCIMLLLGLFLAPAPASAALYVFEQEGPSSHPDDVSFSASISVDGSLADLPTIWNNQPLTPPLDFGKLLAFFFSVGETAGLDNYDTTLANFTLLEGGESLPLWSISPLGIMFTEIDYDFLIDGFGPASTIEFSSDGGPCFLERCSATGRWVAAVDVPEPLTIWMLAAGLFLMGAYRVRRMPRREPQPNFDR
jgi:hypothetical protein